MSHELRTPLNAVIGFSEVLLDQMFGEVNERQTEYLRDIWSSGRHLLELLNDILDLSKVEAGKMELENSRFLASDAIAQAATLVRERAQLHGIALVVTVEPDVGEIEADELRFRQVLLNLLSNAVKFTPDGGEVRLLAASFRCRPGRDRDRHRHRGAAGGSRAHLRVLPAGSSRHAARRRAPVWA